MIVENTEDLKSWLIDQLRQLCDADPNALAKYVLALIRKDKPDDELKQSMLDQLDVFLQKKTIPFVEKLFESLKSGDYLLNKENSGEKTSGNMSKDNTSNRQDGSSDGIVQYSSSEENHGMVSIKKEDDAMNSSNEILDCSISTLEPFDSATECGSNVEDKLNTSLSEISSCSSTYGKHVRISDDLASSAVRKDNRGMSRKSRSRSPRRNRSSRSPHRSDRFLRRSWSPKDQPRPGRSSRRSPNRLARNSRDIYDRRRASSRNRSSSPPYSRRRTSPSTHSRHNTSNSSSSTSSRRNIYVPKRIRSPIRSRSRSPLSRSSRNNDATHEDFTFANKNGNRCKDYDEKGLCMRGELCPFDHGHNPVVLKDVGAAAGIGLKRTVQLTATNDGNLGVIQNVPYGSTNSSPDEFQQLIRPSRAPMMPATESDLHNQMVWGPMGPFPSGGRVRGMMLRPPMFSAPNRELINVPVLGGNGGGMSGRNRDDELHLGMFYGGNSGNVPPPPPGTTPVVAVAPMGAGSNVMGRLGNNIRGWNSNNMGGRGPGRGLGGTGGFDHSRLGSKTKNYTNCSLEVKRIPSSQNTISDLNSHFVQYGKIINIQINFEGDPEAALITYSSPSEAYVAYKSVEPILNNRFIRVFWHNKEKENEEVDDGMIRVPIRDRLGAIDHSNEDGMETENDKVLISGINVTKTVYNPTPAKREISQEKVQAVEAIKKSQEQLAAHEQAKREQQEKKRETFRLMQDLQKKKQTMLVEQLEQQKKLIHKLETNKNMKSEEKEEMMKLIKSLQESIETIKKGMDVITKARNKAPNTPSSSNSPTKSVLHQQQQKSSGGGTEATRDVLDAEKEGNRQTNLEPIIAGIVAGSDPSDYLALKERLNDSKIQHHRGSATYRGRGGRGGAAAALSSSKFGSGRRGGYSGSVRSGTNSLTVDRRTTTILIKKFPVDILPELMAHFAQFGVVPYHRPDYDEPSLVMKYENRKCAETAFLKGRVYKDFVLDITWVKKEDEVEIDGKEKDTVGYSSSNHSRSQEKRNENEEEEDSDSDVEFPPGTSTNADEILISD